MVRRVAVSVCKYWNGIVSDQTSNEAEVFHVLQDKSILTKHHGSGNINITDRCVTRKDGIDTKPQHLGREQVTYTEEGYSTVSWQVQYHVYKRAKCTNKQFYPIQLQPRSVTVVIIRYGETKALRGRLPAIEPYEPQEVYGNSLVSHFTTTAQPKDTSRTLRCYPQDSYFTSSLSLARSSMRQLGR